MVHCTQFTQYYVAGMVLALVDRLSRGPSNHCNTQTIGTRVPLSALLKSHHKPLGWWRRRWTLTLRQQCCRSAHVWFDTLSKSQLNKLTPREYDLGAPFFLLFPPSSHTTTKSKVYETAVGTHVVRLYRTHDGPLLRYISAYRCRWSGMARASGSE